MLKKLKSKSVLHKLPKIIVIVLAVVVVIAVIFYLSTYISQKLNPPAAKIEYGITFSPLAAEALNLQWRKVYTDMLSDLQIKTIRIPSYWPAVEPTENVYEFADVDFMVKEAEKHQSKVILAVGLRQPRWPECHQPLWAAELPTREKQQKIKQLITKVVERYKDNKTVAAFQVENEPLFPIWATYCDHPDEKFFKSEVELVRSLTDKTIITSASGEWDNWIPQMQVTDKIGISLYRHVHNKYTGYFSYPLIPGYYSLKSSISRKFAPQNQKTIITELQTEPWFGDYNPVITPIQKQRELFSLHDFKSNIEYAQKTGFDEIYLWGIEWWYFMKEQGDAQYWNYAKSIYSSN